MQRCPCLTILIEVTLQALQPLVQYMCDQELSKWNGLGHVCNIWRSDYFADLANSTYLSIADEPNAGEKSILYPSVTAPEIKPDIVQKTRSVNFGSDFGLPNTAAQAETEINVIEEFINDDRDIVSSPVAINAKSDTQADSLQRKSWFPWRRKSESPSPSREPSNISQNGKQENRKTNLADSFESFLVEQSSEKEEKLFNSAQEEPKLSSLSDLSEPYKYSANSESNELTENFGTSNFRVPNSHDNLPAVTSSLSNDHLSLDSFKYKTSEALENKGTTAKHNRVDSLNLWGETATSVTSAGRNSVDEYEAAR